nr:retrovirus-related Pol polyprotein LINE-1 [Tanacetum cinerariifolium]
MSEALQYWARFVRNSKIFQQLPATTVTAAAGHHGPPKNYLFWIEVVDSDGHLRSCPRLGVVDGGRRTRSCDRLASPYRIRVGSWNIGSLMRKLLELCDTLRRHKVDIACFQETKWKGSRAREGKATSCGEAIGSWRFQWLLRERPLTLSAHMLRRGDLNGHIRAVADGYTGVYGGFGFGDRNKEGCTILEFATAHELVVVNSFFKKNDAHLITFQSGGHNTQINYLMVHRGDLRACKDCRAYPETFRACVVEKLMALEEVMFASGADQMWNTLAHVKKDVEKESLGVANETTRTRLTHGESWWFCEEVQTKVTLKQSRFKELLSCQLPTALPTSALLSSEGFLLKRKEKYSPNLFLISSSLTMDQQGEVKTALKKMVRNKVVGPDQIPIEAWRSLKDEGVKWLTFLFNKIFSSAMMPDEWRLIKIIPIYKNKGDAQECSNYRGIKLLSHTMKLWKRVIESRLKRETMVSENQFGFMPRRSTTEAIHLLRSLMEKYRERQKDLNMAFLDLEKVYDSVPRELVWKTLIDKGTPRRYSKVIKDMYEGAKTRVRTTVGNTNFFSIKRKALEDNGLRVSKEKMEYLRCDFDRYEVVHQEMDIRIGDQIIQPKESFKYLGLVIHRSRRINDDVVYRIRAGPVMMYGSECWPITKAQATRVEVAKLRILRWICGKTMIDMIPNGVFRVELDVNSIVNKMRERRLRWFRHVKRRPRNASVKRVKAMEVEGSRRRGSMGRICLHFTSPIPCSDGIGPRLLGLLGVSGGSRGLWWEGKRRGESGVTGMGAKREVNSGFESWGRQGSIF